MVCVVGRMRDLILQLSKSSIYSTKPINGRDIGSQNIYVFHIHLIFILKCVFCLSARGLKI
ncbi:hypothetical protein DTU12_19835 [Salmonella enterica subsp. enterica serovar Indiana]|nr:hypothetical protein [Salmonella enterica subsp. enterica serovar Indiana]